MSSEKTPYNHTSEIVSTITTHATDISSVSNMSLITDGQTTVVTPDIGHSRTIVYVLVPLGTLALVAFLALIIVLVLRKSKLDRLRHHLMPMYSFDPAEENPDWESELLEDQEKEVNQPTASVSSPMLKFLPRR